MKEAIEFVLVGAISCLVILGSFSLVAFVNLKTGIVDTAVSTIPVLEIAPTEAVSVPEVSPAVIDTTATSADVPSPVVEDAPESVSLSKITLPAVPHTTVSTAPKPKPAPTVSASGVVDAPLTEAEIKSILSLHNSARREDGVDSLTWSSVLTKSAQSWAHSLAVRDCALEHSGGPYGETIYYSRKYGSGQTPRKPAEVMDAFLDEKQFYNYAKNTCKAGEICGHYTQIVWGTTTEVGCARSLCIDDEREEVWVCHYNPQGNIEGLRPY